MGKWKTQDWTDDSWEAKQAQPPVESRALPSHLSRFENLYAVLKYGWFSLYPALTPPFSSVSGHHGSEAMMMIRVKEGETRGKEGRTRKRRFIGLQEEISKEAT